MPRGIADIPELRLSVLQNFITTFMDPPDLMLSNMFGTENSPSDSIEWESQRGQRGLAPFVAPGQRSPETAPIGVAQHSAKAAFIKERMYFDEEFLNNLRKAGTEAQYEDATTRLARELAGLKNRNRRRKEWMFAKMFFSGSFSYEGTGGIKLSVDYDLPSDMQVSLGNAYKWSTGTSRDIIGDIIDGKKKVKDECGGVVDTGFCSSTVLKYIAYDPTIQTLLQRSAFGQGDLFSGAVNKLTGVNPKVVGSLLDIPNLVVYDEVYEVRAWLTSAVTADSTTAISVSDVTDFVVGGTLKFVDVSEGTYEEETISAVNPEAGTVTVSSAPSTSYKAGEDYVMMTREFVPDTLFSLMASRVEGQRIATFKQAPYSLPRHYGIKVDRWFKRDPEGVYIRVQDKGLPILWHRAAMYNLTVA